MEMPSSFGLFYSIKILFYNVRYVTLNGRDAYAVLKRRLFACTFTVYLLLFHKTLGKHQFYRWEKTVKNLGKSTEHYLLVIEPVSYLYEYVLLDHERYLHVFHCHCVAIRSR